MRRVNELQIRSGLHMQEDLDWDCASTFSFRLDQLRHIEPKAEMRVLPAFEVLHLAEPLDPKSTDAILDALFFAERVLIEQAGTLEAFVEFCRHRLPQHPAMPWALPVAYATLGRWDEGEEYIAACRKFYAAEKEPLLVATYDRFIREVRADRQQ
jgi:hypothetical protein